MLNKDYKYYLPATNLIPSGLAVAPINKRYPVTIASLSGVEPSFSISVYELKNNKDLLESTFGLLTVKYRTTGGHDVGSSLYGFSSYPYFVKIMSLIQYAGDIPFKISAKDYTEMTNESFCFSSCDIDKLDIKAPPFRAKERNLHVMAGTHIFLPSYLVYYLSVFGVVDTIPLPVVKFAVNIQTDKIRIENSRVYKFNVTDKSQVASILAKASFFRDSVMLNYMQLISAMCDTSIRFYHKLINDGILK